MNKKGFTLIELLAVIIILALVMSIGTISVVHITEAIKTKMLKTRVETIETSAINWGQENLDKLTQKCNNIKIEGLQDIKEATTIDSNFCITKTVRELINAGFIETDEIDSNKNKTYTNNVTGKSMLDDTVIIYRKNNRVYAIMKEIKSSK